MKNSYKRGDIILIQYPFTDHSSSKVRPAFVLRDQDDQDLNLLPVSSTFQIKPYDYVLDKKDYAGKPLPIKSVIRIGKSMTIQSNLALKKVGRIKEESIKAVLGAFRFYFDI